MRFPDELGKATEIAAKIGSTVAGTIDLAAELGKDIPWIGPALKTLRAIRAKVEQIHENRGKLEALRDRCDYYTAITYVKWCNSRLNIGQLQQVLEDVERTVIHCASHGRVGEAAHARAVESEINLRNLELDRVGIDLGLMGTVVGVSDLTSRFEHMEQDNARRHKEVLLTVATAMTRLGHPSLRPPAPRPPPFRSRSAGSQSVLSQSDRSQAGRQPLATEEAPVAEGAPDTVDMGHPGDDEVEGDIRPQMDELFTYVGSLRDGMDRLSHMMEVMLLKISATEHPYPELVHLVPAPALRKKRFLKGFFVEEMLLVFRCPYDLSVVPCGWKGQGYPLKVRRNDKLIPLAMMTMQLTSLALKVVSGVEVAIPQPPDVASSAFKEAISNSALSEDSLRDVLEGNEDESRIRGLLHSAYESLKLWMAENEGLNNAEYTNFRSEMQLVGDGKGGVVWVSNKNVEKWRESVRGW